MTDVLIKRELLEDLRDCANECYNHARFRRTSDLDNYERLTEQADAIIARLRKAEKDAARWDMLVKIYDHVLTHPDSMKHDAEYGRYKTAIEAGLGITGAIDAAMAGGVE